MKYFFGPRGKERRRGDEGGGGGEEEEEGEKRGWKEDVWEGMGALRKGFERGGGRGGVRGQGRRREGGL